MAGLCLGLALAGSAASAVGPAITVTGSVLHQSEVVAGAEIRLLNRNTRHPRRALDRVRSDSRGRFSIEVPWKRDIEDRLSWRLVIEATDLAPRVIVLGLEISEQSPGSEAVLGGLLLEVGCDVRGTVLERVGETTRPLAGASVVAWHREFDRAWKATTKLDGSFSLSHLMSGGYALGIAHQSRIPARRDLKVTCLPGEQLEPIVLSEGVEVLVEAALEEGGPAAGAFYYSAPMPPRGVATTWLQGVPGFADDAGRFRVPVGGSESPWLIRVRRVGSLPGSVSWSDRLPPQPLSVVLKSVRRVGGRVTDELRDSVEAAAVGIFRLEALDQEILIREVATDRNGLFDTGILGKGDYRLRFLAPGYEPAVEDVTLGADVIRPRSLDVPLTARDLVEGSFEVLDSAASPVEGAEVEAMSLATLEWIPPCHTAVDGRCKISGLPKDERTRISVAHPAFDEISTLVQRVDPERHLTMVLPELEWDLLAVRGTVRDDSGVPVAGARVSLTEPFRHSSKLRQTGTAVDGSFTLAEVPEGGYALEVLAPGWAASVTTLKVTADMAPADVVLQPGALIRGRLLGWNKSRYPGVSVRSAIEPSLECLVIGGGAQGLPRPPGGTIDGNEYTVEHLPPGEWVLSTISYPSWEGRVSVSDTDRELWVDLARPEPGRCDSSPEVSAAEPAVESDPTELVRDQSLAYSFQYRSGIAPADCLRIELVGVAQSVVAEEFCADSSGVWQGLPRGEYQLRLRHLEDEGWPVVIPSGPQTFVITPTGRLELRPLDLEANFTPGEDWPAGLEVTLLPIGDEDGRQAITATDRVYFHNLEAGWWEVNVKASDGSQWTELVEIREHQQRTLVLR